MNHVRLLLLHDVRFVLMVFEKLRSTAKRKGK